MLEKSRIGNNILWNVLGITIGGDTATDITIDGEQVQEVTIDGNIVWTNTPDISMFSDPQYHWWAGSSSASDGKTTSFPEVLAGVSDASVDSGDPTLNADTDNQYDAIYYDGNDYHEYSEDGSISSFPVTIVALVYFSSFSSYDDFLSWDSGDVDLQISDSGTIGFNINGSNDPGWSNDALSTGTFQTIAWTIDSSGDNITYYVNGSSSGGGNIGGLATPDTGTHHIGYSGWKDSPLNGYIAEIVMTSANESGSSISSYHNDRV